MHSLKAHIIWWALMAVSLLWAGAAVYGVLEARPERAVALGSLPETVTTNYVLHSPMPPESGYVPAGYVPADAGELPYTVFHNAQHRPEAFLAWMELEGLRREAQYTLSYYARCAGDGIPWQRITVPVVYPSVCGLLRWRMSLCDDCAASVCREPHDGLVLVPVADDSQFSCTDQGPPGLTFLGENF